MNASPSALRYDPSGAFVASTGLAPRDLADLAPRLEAARREVLDDDLTLFRSGKRPPKARQPLDAGFIELPERLLAEYQVNAETSELGRLLRVARELGEQVDRVVVLGIGGSYMGAKALIDGCCPAYWNELSRSERANRPRIYYEGNNVDNDASQGLLRLLGEGQPASSPADRWAIIVVSKSGGTLETAVAFRQFLAALKSSLGQDTHLLKQLVVPVTGLTGSKLHALAQALGCREVFPVPEGVGGRFSVFSAVGLLPAAVAGVDILELLRGAAAMNELFRVRPLGANPVLDYVGVGHLLEQKRKCTVRVLSVWSKALEAAGMWYDQLLAESLGKRKKGATPFTAVNTRDLHSRHQQHQQGRFDKLITNVVLDEVLSKPLAVGSSSLDQDGLNDLAERTLPDLMRAAIAGTNQALRDDGRPTATFSLPALTPFYLGQFLQMFMLATAVEGRLLGINPYGQPGVEGYKQNMNRLLGR